jgi:LacI family transcriptional regulator
MESFSCITDVARRAGVSPVTVSRVMNGAPNVNPATRARVEQAIAELGYLPNTVARSLRSKRTRSLALLLPDITNTFWTTVARGVEDTAQGSATRCSSATRMKIARSNSVTWSWLSASA